MTNIQNIKIRGNPAISYGIRESFITGVSVRSNALRPFPVIN